MLIKKYDILLVLLNIFGCVLLWYATGKIFIWEFQIIFVILLTSTGQTYVQRKDKKLEEMWNLANQLGKTSRDLTNYSNLGYLDLEASKKNEKGQRNFYPSSRKIQEIIESLKLEKVNF